MPCSKSKAFPAPLLMKLAKNEQKHVQTSWAKFQRDIKCGKYRYKFIYALKFIVALTTPIFKETHYH
jgi:hypothetical protein